MRLFLGLLLSVSTPIVAEDYSFVSIQSLTEQEIGRLVLPHIYAKLNKKIDIHPLPALRAEQMLSSGKFDGEIMRIFSYGVGNSEVVRVPTPYYTLYTTVFIRQGSKISITKKEDLKNYTIAKVRGVKHTYDMTKDMVKVYNLENTHQMMSFLAKGRADIALTSSIDGEKAIKELGLKNIIPLEFPLAEHPLFHYLHKTHIDKVPEINQTIIAMKSSGELDKILTESKEQVISSK